MSDSPFFAAMRLISPNGKFTQTEVDHLRVVEASFLRRGALRSAITRLEEPPLPTDVPAPIKRHSLRDPAAFFQEAKHKDLLGSLSQDEVDGCNAILKACGEANWAIGDTAYAFGTSFHETGGTMQPIKELGGTAYFKRMYDIQGARPKKARELGNLTPGDGAKYAGRGYVQLTGKTNYAKADKKLKALGLLDQGASLVDTPDLVMRPDIAAAIMIYGMAEGWFTGHDLDDDIPREGLATMQQFIRSRDIINGTDKAEKIAREAMAFQSVLQAGGWSEC